MAEDRYCFYVDWYDPQACLNRRYQLLFFPSDNSVELIDVKARRHFLKRCRQEGVKVSDLYVGNSVTILSRTLKIVELGDPYTARALGSNQEKTVGILTSVHHSNLGRIIDQVYKNGLQITNIRQVVLTAQQAYQVLEPQRDQPNFLHISNAISSGPIVIVELLGADSQRKWANIVGISDVSFELTLESVNRIQDNLLKSRRVGSNTAVYSETTCCVIKPHLVASGMAGAVIFEIQKAGFDISAILAVNFTKPNAEEFLEVYKGVVQEYQELVHELTNGTAIALEIKSPNAYAAFRDFCGPHDPEIARTLRPNTLRAKFGVDKVRNGVHCTDLPEDTGLEVEYFFRILDQ